MEKIARMLIIDDNPIDFAVLHEYNKYRGSHYHLDWANSIAMGHQLLSIKGDYDIVFVDMVGTTLYDFNEEFESLDHDWKIVMSGTVMPQNKFGYSFMLKEDIVEMIKEGRLPKKKQVVERLV